jgi:Flp pilus assembly protein TadD/predicted  nucleic acid-binding Zn-ribbon protein
MFLRSLQFSALAFFLGASMTVPPLAAQQNPGSYDVEGVYLKGFMMVQEAEKLERQGNYAGAYFKYKEANEVFDSVARGYPDWQASMVNYRRNLVRRNMEQARQKERARREERSGAGGTAEGAELLPNVDESGAPFSEATPPPPATVRPTVPTTPAAGGLDRQIGQMDQRLQGFNTQSAELQQRLQSREAELFEVNQKLLASKREINAALQKQIELQNLVDTASVKRDREVSSLKKQLETATAALEQASQSQNEATTKIDGLLQELSAARQTMTQLGKERDELAAEKNQLLALVQGKDGLAAAEALLDENKRLKRQLDEANTKVATLSTDKESAVKEAVALREQIAAVRDELDRSKEENEAYRQQIAGLRTKLEAATDQLVDATPLTKDDSELAGENRMLRKMIVDQLKHQTFREEKKRLALEQLAKLQISNEELLGTLDQIAAPPPTLSPEETQRIQDPVIATFMENQGVAGTIIARAEDGAGPPATAAEAGGGPAVDGATGEEGERPARPVRGLQSLSDDLKTVAEAGLGSFARGRYWESRRAFQTILREDPTNLFGLSNLAVTQVKQQDFAGAEKTLKKALAYSEQDAFCHYLLGVVGYRQGQLEEAERSLINALQLDPKNARAFFTLGCVQNKRGDLVKAQDAFTAAVGLEPAYADAHYNLAVILANAGDLEKAAVHYQSAMGQGASRDPALEQVLGVSASPPPPPAAAALPPAPGVEPD